MFALMFAMWVPLHVSEGKSSPMDKRRSDARRRWRCISPSARVLAALALISASGRAEPTAAEKETARALMAEGRDLREHRDLKAALKSFQSADSIMRVPTTALEVARTQVALGQLVEARETLHRLASIPETPSDPIPFRDARSEAEKLDGELGRRIGGVRFDIRRPPDAGELTLSVDGVPIPTVFDVPFRVNPGHHLVIAKVGVTDIMREVDVGEVDITTVVLDFTRVKESVIRTASGAETSSDASSPGRTHPLVYVGFGVGAVGLTVGAITGALALANKKSAEQGCVAGQCPPETWSDVDRMNTYASISTVSFVFAGLGVACGVTTLVLTRPSAAAGATSSGAVRISAAPNGFVVRGDF
jgi:hypothetical protein